MKAAEYLALFKPTCTFHLWGPDLKPGEVAHVCGKPVVGVYITADDRNEGHYLCADHAKEAEHADGPVFVAVA